MRVNVTRLPFPRTGGGDPWGGIPTGITQNRTVPRMCGVLRSDRHPSGGRVLFPRICGGNPALMLSSAISTFFSPRMRGGSDRGTEKGGPSRHSPHVRGRSVCQERDHRVRDPFHAWTGATLARAPVLPRNAPHRSLQAAGTDAASRGGEPRAAVFCARKKGRGKHGALRTAEAESAAFTIRKQFSRKSQTREWQNRGNT